MPPYKLYHFKSLTSTQDKAREFSKKGLINIIIVADIQTKGRGRFKRKWHSSKGGLWMSILLKPKKAGNMQYLTFIAAISAAESIKKIAKIKASIKWPNDVHYKGKKLCGILTEGIFGRENFAIVGIGVNANQSRFPKSIQGTAASLKMISSKKISIKELQKSIIKNFFYLYSGYYLKNRLGELLKIWEKHSDTLNKTIEVKTRTGRFCGKAVAIDKKDCGLLLKTGSKKIIKIIEGDVSVRY